MSGSFHQKTVLAEERAAIGFSRRHYQVELNREDSPLTGLSLSGGGIRSATFNLGLLQALARRHRLRHLDYLSTVSGGGYIGGWLSAWIHREGLAAVESALAESVTGVRREPPALRWLRAYSNYLTPRKGALSFDTWAAVSNYLRNTLLNFSILILLLCAGLLLPRLLAEALPGLGAEVLLSSATVCLVFAIVALTLGVDGLEASVIRPRGDDPEPFSRWRWHFLENLPSIGAVLFLAMVLCLSAALPGLRDELDQGGLWALPRLAISHFHPGAALASAGLIVSATLVCLGWQDRASARPRPEPAARWARPQTRMRWRYRIGVVVAGLLASTLAAALIADLGQRLGHHRWLEGFQPEVHFLVLASLIGSLVSVATYLFVGLIGRGFSSYTHEFWNRVGSACLLVSLFWFVLTPIALIGPALLDYLGFLVGQVLATGGFIGWLGTCLAGVWAGRSGDTGKRGAHNPKEILARLAPPLFLLGLSLVLAYLVRAAIRLYHGYDAPELSRLSLRLALKLDGTLWSASGTSLCAGDGLVALALLLGIATLLAWRVDINLFSMHMFYRNRLIQAYFGASRRHYQDLRGEDREALNRAADDGAELDDAALNETRNLHLPHPGNRLDPFDAPYLDDLAVGLDSRQRGNDFSRPLHLLRPYWLINTALNLTSINDERLAWQDRQAAAFLLSPLYCGYTLRARDPEAGCYQPTADYLRDDLPRDENRPECPTRRLSAGTAIATSGAAASPNMGYHSNRAVAFLLTLFNVRLGLWLQNPGSYRAWRRTGPGFGLGYLLKELTGTASPDDDFVYLSDGGHFDNLGIYELVRRGTGIIIASDASADPGFRFDDLTAAIRLCRVDFGVEIVLRTPVMVDGQAGFQADGGPPRCRHHALLGEVFYPAGFQGQSQARRGLLVYIKASLTGNEPADVLGYRANHGDFPHEATGDQWFDEAQFESYRKLGEHIGSAVLAALEEDPESLWGEERTDPNGRLAWAGSLVTRQSHGETVTLVDEAEMAGLRDLLRHPLLAGAPV